MVLIHTIMVLCYEKCIVVINSLYMLFIIKINNKILNYRIETKLKIVYVCKH